jgi:predicted acyltransferase
VLLAGLGDAEKLDVEALRQFGGRAVAAAAARRARSLAIACGTLLLGYWALLAFAPMPGGTPGDLREGHNLVNWFDSQFLPGRKYDRDHDPEGILSTIPAIANCILGVLAGIFLRTTRAEGSRKSLLLVAGGAALLALGLLWSVPFPMIKKLWTSSFVLFACGCSAILLGAFHQIIEVRKMRAWAEPFIWIGLNNMLIKFICGHGIDGLFLFRHRGSKDSI